MVKKKWVCNTCFLVFSRKWNFERHLQLMHGSNEHVAKPQSVQSGNNILASNENSNVPLFGLKENFKEVYDFVDMRDRMTNSSQLFNQINSLQSQVASLQQQLSSYDKQMNDIFYDNWLLPKSSIQGISGCLCKICKSFSLKPIFDLGCDMTMEGKHQCNNEQGGNNYLIFKPHSGVLNIDQWAGVILLDYVNFYSHIGKYLFTKDITLASNNLQKKLGSEFDDKFLGIPERYSLYRTGKNDFTSWIDRATRNDGTTIILSDDEKKDFLMKVKSTYGIIDIKTEGLSRRIYVALISRYNASILFLNRILELGDVVRATAID